MFEDLKVEIRREIGGQKVNDLNDQTAKKLDKILDEAYENRDFEKAIAALELYLEDLGGYYAENAFGVKVQLLAMYDDCGLYATNEAMQLVNALIKERQDAGMGESVVAAIDLPAIRIYMASGDKDNIEMAKILMDSCIEVGLRNIGKFQDDSSFKTLARVALREKMRYLIKEGRYEEADDLYYQVGVKSRELTDPISKVLYDLLMVYALTDVGEKFVNQAWNDLFHLKDVVPEANYILGIMAADGYHTSVNTNKVKEYFSHADDVVCQLKGRVGYTDYEFSVFSSISKEQVINEARDGTYHSKFYHAMLKNKTSAASQNEPSDSENSSDSSGGCYVATCVYGSYDCPQVWTLRRYRDSSLAVNPFGRAFIKAYYAISPTVVKLFGSYSWFHTLFKKPLDKWVKTLNERGVENTPYND